MESGGKKAWLPELVRIARPGFWATSMWFYLLPLGGTGVYTAAPFWVGLLYAGLPLGLLIYGWNDWADAGTDRRNPRKGSYLFGAQAPDCQLRRLPAVIACVQAPFWLYFGWVMGFKALALAAAIVAFTGFYNGRGVGLKNFPFLDLINQSGYLAVFVLSSWLNGVPHAPLATYAFGVLFAMHAHLFGATMDIEPDRAAGRKTTAIILGRRGAKGMIAALLLAEAIVVFVWLRQVPIAAALLGVALWFCVEALAPWGSKPYTRAQMNGSLLAWNATAVLTAPWIWHTAAFGAAQ